MLGERVTDDGQRRQVRLRLARRRPAPGRVRARIPEDSPDSTPDGTPGQSSGEPDAVAATSRLRRLWLRVRRAKWNHIITLNATALAAVAAIGGLWAQALATYWDSRTARDQLSQSRDDSKKEQRSQASRVSFWTESTDDLQLFVHVHNRSPDPVSRTALYTEAVNSSTASVLLVPTLRPCSETILKWNWSDDSELDPNSAITGSMFLFFTDRNGTAWRREPRGLSIEDDDALTGVKMKLISLPHRRIEVEKAPSCDDGAG